MNVKIIFIVFYLLLYITSKAAVTVTPAVGGSSLCADSYTILDNITITEGIKTDVLKTQNNVTLILSCPTNYEFKSGIGYISYVLGMDITAISLAVTTTTITITFTSSTSENGIDIITISGIQAKASSALPVAASGNILRSIGNPGTAVIAGIVNGTTNFGTLAQGNAMAYSSCTTAQQNINNIQEGSVNNDILRVQIIVSDRCNPAITTTSFTFNTTGSTDPANDITKARLYYTGSSTTYSTTTLVSTQDAPNGDFTLTATTLLNAGNNYFWLAYDMAVSATLANIVDAECTSITVGGTPKTPAITAPANSRTIGIATISSKGNGGGNWNDATTWNGGIIPDATNHVTILAGDVISLNADASCVDISINGGSGGTLNIGSNKLSVLGTLNVTAPGSISTTCNSQLDISDYGLKPQLTIPSSITLLQKLSINRSAGVACNHDLNLSNCVPADSVVLVLSNGILAMTSGAKLLLNSISIQLEIPCSDNSHVDGIVSRIITSRDKMYVFPLGDGGISRRFAISQNSGADGTHEVVFLLERPINYCCINSGFLPGGILQRYYWKDVIPIPGGNPQRRIYYEDSDFPNFTSMQRIAYLTLANNPVLSPTDEWRTPTTGYTVYDNVGQKFCQFNNANASNNIYWTFGSTNALAPLPISLVYFNAVEKNRIVQLRWGTSSESNNDFYTVERSLDANIFNAINIIKGAGNSNSLLHYQSADEDPPYNTIVYYRLKQTDFNGNISYSPIISLTVKDYSPQIIVSNINGNIIIEANSPADMEAVFSIVDVTGKNRLNTKLHLKKGANYFSFPTNINENVPYVVNIVIESQFQFTSTQMNVTGMNISKFPKFNTVSNDKNFTILIQYNDPADR